MFAAQRFVSRDARCCCIACRSGTVEANGGAYNWRVSAIALSEVYDIAGLPDTAIYVGIRMTAA